MKFEVIFLLIYWFKLYQTFFRNKMGWNETITTYFGCLVKVSYKTNLEAPKYIVWLARCKILSNIAGTENFTIEHTNLWTNFFGNFYNRHVSFDLKYFKTHNKVPLSVNVFLSMGCRIRQPWQLRFSILS